MRDDAVASLIHLISSTSALHTYTVQQLFKALEVNVGQVCLFNYPLPIIENPKAVCIVYLERRHSVQFILVLCMMCKKNTNLKIYAVPEI